MKAQLTDLNDNQLNINDIIDLNHTKFPFIFTQNELLEVCAKELFRQQLAWKTVQEKECDECDKIEREIKRMPRQPHCSDVMKRLEVGFGVRDLRSPKHTISYNTCLSKLEELVKAQWDEWEEKQAKRSIR